MIRSGGTPFVAHLATACGDKGGEKIAPTAAYEPIRRQAFSKAGFSTPAIINCRLMRFNPQLLPQGVAAAHHQPMVEAMADRLRKLMKSQGLSYEKFGAIAGVSAQAVQKWFAGGDAKDGPLAKLATHFKVTVAWIRYGDEKAKPSAREASANYGGLPPAAVDLVTRWMGLSPDRQDALREIIFTMHWVEKRFPAMTRARLKGYSYDELEHAFEKTLRQLKAKSE
jgi:transcriptional regulator with XRE-family HTH domain